MHWRSLRIIDSRCVIIDPATREARLWLARLYNVRELTREEKKIESKTKFGFLRCGFSHEKGDEPRTWGPNDRRQVDWSGFENDGDTLGTQRPIVGPASTHRRRARR